MTINSTNIDQWDATLAAGDADEVDVLLVSPERLANPPSARHPPTRAPRPPPPPVRQRRTPRSAAQMSLPQHCDVALQTAVLPRP